MLAALGVAALPAANDYDECKRDDLYKSLQWDGEVFCSMILDPDCYTSVSTPVDYATYDGDKLSSYVRAKRYNLHLEMTDLTNLYSARAFMNRATPQQAQHPRRFHLIR